ncbi:MAG: hypothetical protein HY851_04190 [candidate division Zixibacteria bacterium]|nr:hypothetical protein [candidate division Zixibacteria bacterium]
MEEERKVGAPVRHRSGLVYLTLEFWDFLKVRKKWWLLPIILMLLLTGTLIVLGQTAAAPFIYTLF